MKKSKHYLKRTMFHIDMIHYCKIIINVATKSRKCHRRKNKINHSCFLLFSILSLGWVNAEQRIYLFQNLNRPNLWFISKSSISYFSTNFFFFFIFIFQLSKQWSSKKSAVRVIPYLFLFHGMIFMKEM